MRANLVIFGRHQWRTKAKPKTVANFRTPARSPGISLSRQRSRFANVLASACGALLKPVYQLSEDAVRCCSRRASSPDLGSYHCNDADDLRLAPISRPAGTVGVPQRRLSSDRRQPRDGYQVAVLVNGTSLAQLAHWGMIDELGGYCGRDTSAPPHLPALGWRALRGTA
jgi:hypothetical protein